MANPEGPTIGEVFLDLHTRAQLLNIQLQKQRIPREDAYFGLEDSELLLGFGGGGTNTLGEMYSTYTMLVKCAGYSATQSLLSVTSRNDNPPKAIAVAGYRGVTNGGSPLRVRHDQAGRIVWSIEQLDRSEGTDKLKPYVDTYRNSVPYALHGPSAERAMTTIGRLPELKQKRLAIVTRHILGSITAVERIRDGEPAATVLGSLGRHPDLVTN